jgi:hypothetical protein
MTRILFLVITAPKYSKSARNKQPIKTAHV